MKLGTIDHYVGGQGFQGRRSKLKVTPINHNKKGRIEERRAD